MPRIVAGGSRSNTYKNFCTAFYASTHTDFVALLVDSEGPVTSKPWSHLKEHDNWHRPDAAADDKRPTDGPVDGILVLWPTNVH